VRVSAVPRDADITFRHYAFKQAGITRLELFSHDLVVVAGLVRGDRRVVWVALTYRRR
jgi:hypothetical protein